MKRSLLVSLMLLASVAGAHADYFETTYHDLIRTHGKPRSDAIYQANLDACYSQTGEDRTRPDIPAFRQCMLKRGYRFQSQRLVETGPAPVLPPLGAIGVYTYDDALGRSGRAGGESAEQAATRACDRGSPERIGTPAFNACMGARGWRFASFAPAAPEYDSSPSAEPDAPAAADDTAASVAESVRNQDAVNAQLAADAATAASQAQLNAANLAAATQP
jgi:hypothetical protein